MHNLENNHFSDACNGDWSAPHIARNITFDDSEDITDVESGVDDEGYDNQ